MGLVGGSRLGTLRGAVVVEILRWSLTGEPILQSVDADELLFGRWLLSNPYWYTIPPAHCPFLAVIEIRLGSGRSSAIGYDRVSRLWYCMY